MMLTEMHKDIPPACSVHWAETIFNPENHIIFYNLLAVFQGASARYLRLSYLDLKINCKPNL